MKKKILIKITLILILINSSFVLTAQTPNWKWAITTGDQANDFAKDVTTDAAGNVYMTGMFTSSIIDFGGIKLTKSTGSYFNIYVAKYNASGSVIWAKNFGAAGYEESWGIATDSSGNVYITGIFTSPSITFGAFTLTNSAANYDGVFVVKLDTNGNVLWAEKGIGTALDKESNDIAVDPLGNITITGYTSYGTLNFDGAFINNTNNGNLYVVKFDTNGNVLWSKSQAATSQNRADGVATDAEGNIYITGFYTSSIYNLPTSSGRNAFLVKFSSAGDFLWAVSSSTSNNDTYGFDVHATSSGKVIITGSFSNSTVTFGTVTLTNAVTNGNPDIYIAQYDASGTLEWAKSGSGSSYDRGFKVTSDAMGSVYLTGFFESPTIKFGSITLTKATNVTQSGYVTKYNTTGNEVWAIKIDRISAGSTSPNGGLATDASGNVILAGYCSDNVVFGSITIPDGGIFLAKLSDGVMAVDNINNSSIRFYPNPVKDVVHFSGEKTISKVTIFTTDGRKIREKQLNGTKQIDISDLSKGIYLFRLQTETGTEQTKIIKN
jgi:hypothetical protein